MKINDLFKKDIEINWDYIFEIPEFKILDSIKQSTVWHSEGNVGNHTRFVARIMELMCKERNIYKDNNERYKMLIAAALCHDLGKATSTFLDPNDGDYHCVDHGKAGEVIVRTLFADEEPTKLDYLAKLVRWHMAFHKPTLDDKKIRKNILKIVEKQLINFEDMYLLNCADTYGSLNNEEYNKRLKKYEEVAKELNLY